MEQISKQYSFKSQVDEGKREVISIISTDAIDRDGEVVLPSGRVKNKNFAGNPVVLVNHQMDKLPVGSCRWVSNDGNKVLAKSYISDKTQDARDLFGLLQDGVISGCSINFLPLEAGLPTPKEIKERPELVNCKKLIRKWELIEYSFVTVPCNPECLTLAVSKGYSPGMIKFLNGGIMPETKDLITDDYCQWDEAPVIKALELPAAVTKQAAAPVDKWANIPLPKYSRPIESIVAERLDKLSKRFSNNDILDKYMGRV